MTSGEEPVDPDVPGPLMLRNFYPLDTKTAFVGALLQRTMRLRLLKWMAYDAFTREIPRVPEPPLRGLMFHTLEKSMEHGTPYIRPGGGTDQKLVCKRLS